jgi:hypothetical protein
MTDKPQRIDVTAVVSRISEAGRYIVLAGMDERICVPDAWPVPSIGEAHVGAERRADGRLWLTMWHKIDKEDSYGT